MRGLLATIRIGLLDLRGDFRRFVLLIVCLAVGTALIAGVSSVGASIRQAVDKDAALLMGGDVELSRGDRPATDGELALFEGFGQVSRVVDTNVSARAGERDAFVDLIAVGETYPLLGQVGSPEVPSDRKAFAFLAADEAGSYGALVDPVMLDELQMGVGDGFELAGTPMTVRGTLYGLPDAAVRGFRLGSPVVISTDALAILSDRTSPLPGLGTWFRYKVLLATGNGETGKTALEAALNDPSWTVRTARDGLGPMVRYYDIFMRFLTIVGLASLLIGGVSVWSGFTAYVAERAKVIAVLRSMGASRGRVFLHFFSQIATLALIGVGIGVGIGAVTALIALPIVGQAVGVRLAPTLHIEPLLVSAGVGLLTAFAFAYLPLQQAQTISPVTLFRSKGLAAPPIDWLKLIASTRILPLVAAGAAFVWLAILMTDDPPLVAAFAVVSVLATILFQAGIRLARRLVARLPENENRVLRHALQGIVGSGSNAPAVVVSVGMALAMLVVVLVLQVNMRNEYLGASVFDAPTLVASDLFEDEAATLEQMRAEGVEVKDFTATPMMRGELVAVNGMAAADLRTRGPEASFLLSGDVPLTYRGKLPASSRLVEGEWWPADYSGEPLVSLHQNLKAGMGLKLGDAVSFEIFGETVTAKVASFRDYSWQGGIDFLATFSPGVLEQYPATLLGAVTAVPGHESTLERDLAGRLPDIRFIAIGETLEQITAALGQLALAAALIGGLAVGNGLLVLIGSLATGRRQRQADAVITKVLGAKRGEVIAVSVVQHLILAAFAALLAVPLGIVLAWALTQVMLDVQFAVDATTLAAVVAVAIAITGLLGAATIYKVLSLRPARLLREMGAD